MTTITLAPVILGILIMGEGHALFAILLVQLVMETQMEIVSHALAY